LVNVLVVKYRNTVTLFVYAAARSIGMFNARCTPGRKSEGYVTYATQKFEGLVLDIVDLLMIASCGVSEPCRLPRSAKYMAPGGPIRRFASGERLWLKKFSEELQEVALANPAWSRKSEGDVGEMMEKLKPALRLAASLSVKRPRGFCDCSVRTPLFGKTLQNSSATLPTLLGSGILTALRLILWKRLQTLFLKKGR
jgi:hypothetical protein